MNNKYLISIFFLLFSVAVLAQEPSQVTIIQPINGTVFDGEQITVVYYVSGTEPKLAKIFLDDKPVRLLGEADVKIGQNTVTVDVPARDCKISIVVQNDYGASVPAVVNLTRSEYIFKPTLYVLAVGVSKYTNPELQLQFPAKDAIDFSQSMLKQKGLLYENVELRILTDELANAESIRTGLNWLQTETTFRDVAMLYMAGHGVNNNVGDFFFVPVNADLNMINASCVGYREIKETIDAVAGKILVFMDACHSGNVLGNNQRRAAMVSQAIADLTDSENGAVVFTSSTGRQFSLENPEWNNGAFTKALVEGLNGKADLFGKETVTVKSLDSYVANRVKELTKGQQAPTTIIPSSVPDFPLAIVNVNVNINIEVTAATTPVARKHPVYLSLAAGVTNFGSYAPGEIQNSGAIVFGADVAYLLNTWLGAGVKFNMANCDVNFGDDETWRDRVTFIGPGLYGRWAKNRIEFTAGAAVGSLRWNMLNMKVNDVAVSNKSVNATGAFLWTGINYMLTHNTGIAMNVQSALGTVKTDGGAERNPAGAGVTIGINFRF